MYVRDRINRRRRRLQRVTAFVICAAQRILVGAPYYMKTYRKEIERSGVDLIYMARDKEKRRAVVNPPDSELSGSVKREEFRDQLRNS